MMEFNYGPALLFCPADRPDRYEKALSRADAVIIDLEDSVLPAAKVEARQALRDSNLDPERVIVRVNPAGTDDFRADLAIIARTRYRTVLIAKAESAISLSDVPRSYELMALLETARGVQAAPEIAALDNVTALMWGAEDLVASIGGTSSRHSNGEYRAVARHSRSRVLLAAAAEGKATIDAVHTNIPDLDGQRAEAEDAAASGFRATACIHPSQVQVVRDAYRPSDSALEWAAAVITAAEHEHGVFTFREEMIDEPVLRQARAILSKATHVKEE